MFTVAIRVTVLAPVTLRGPVTAVFPVASAAVYLLEPMARSPSSWAASAATTVPVFLCEGVSENYLRGEKNVGKY